MQHLSIGVEALVDRHLRTLCRPYTASQVKEAVARAVSHGFKCVNVDVMFALPGQTCREIEDTGRELVRLGVDQVAAYPLFLFPYTPMGRTESPAGTRHPAEPQEARDDAHSRGDLLPGRLREDFGVGVHEAGGAPVLLGDCAALPGSGASGGSYLRDVFYLNTFSVAEYVKALEDGRMGVALSVDLTEAMQRAGWLYWRIYETRFRRADYLERFGEELDGAYGRYSETHEPARSSAGRRRAHRVVGSWGLLASRVRGPAVDRLRQQALGCVTARRLAGPSRLGVNPAHAAAYCRRVRQNPGLCSTIAPGWLRLVMPAACFLNRGVAVRSSGGTTPSLCFSAMSCSSDSSWILRW